MNKIEYLNKRIQLNNQCPYEGPKSLFKYRPFDEHIFDMLENRYLYLCPAEKLDDPTECITSLDIDKIYNVDKDSMSERMVDSIMRFIKPYSKERDFENASIIAKTLATMDPSNRSEYMSKQLKNAAPTNIDTAPIVKSIEELQNLDLQDEKTDHLKWLIGLAINARQKIGICSLSENNDIDYMWKNYAADSSGYCIEYDMEHYEGNKDILPVIYQDERETNIIIQLVGSFIGQMITGFSNGQIAADKSHFIRLFLTKYKKWEYQNEWRLIGEANGKPSAPSVRRIYLGKNVVDENKQKMIQYADKNKIEVVILKG